MVSQTSSGAALLSLTLFALTFFREPPLVVEDKWGVLLLVILAGASETLSLPAGVWGRLSFAYIWLFALCQLYGPSLAALASVVVLTFRIFLPVASTWDARLRAFLTEFLPIQASFLVSSFLANEREFAFPKVTLGAFLPLMVYIVASRMTLRVYSQSDGFDNESAGLQPRRLQITINSVLAPAAAILASYNVWWSLWLVPVAFGVHLLSWDRLEELKELKKKDWSQDRALQRKERLLNLTEDEKQVVERCLAEFSVASGLEDTRSSILAMAREFGPCECAMLAEYSGQELAQITMLDTSGLSSKRPPPDKMGLIERAYQRATVCRDKEGRHWAFPLYESGVLYLGQVRETFGVREKRLLALLARQATFGLRSASLFEKVVKALENETVSRQEAELARVELEASQRRLIQASKMAAVGQLAAGVAHELNSPLATILLSLQSGKRHFSKGRQEKGIESLEQCELAVDKARRIVDGLLTRSKPSDGQKSVFSAAKAAADTCRFLQRQADSAGVELRFREHSKKCVEAQIDEVTQVLTNLILNAVQALRGRSGGWIEVSVFDSEPMVCFQVADNGPGIKQGYIDRIFEPFFTTKDSGQGVGLGLYISQELTQRNSGKLELTQSGPEGSTFVLTLPVHD